MIRVRPLSVLLLLGPAFCGCQGRYSNRKTPSKTRAATPQASTIERSFFVRHDFGVVDSNKKFSASLNLKNDGDRPLTFAFSKASCGCISVKSMPQKIAPGETGSFEIELDTSGLGGPRKYNVLAWDAEPKTILMKAGITALVRSVMADPEAIGLGTISMTEDLHKSLVVLAAGYPDAEIVSAETDTTWISLERQHATTSENLRQQGVKLIGRYRVQWTGKGAESGALASRIIIDVKAAHDDETLVIPVSGYVIANMEIVPSHIVFGQLSASKPIVRTCTLVFHESQPDVSSVLCEPDDSFVEASLDADPQNPSQWKLTARATLLDGVKDRDASKDGLVQGTLAGKDKGGNTVFTVPYTAFVK